MGAGGGCHARYTRTNALRAKYGAPCSFSCQNARVGPLELARHWSRFPSVTRRGLEYALWSSVMRARARKLGSGLAVERAELDREVSVPCDPAVKVILDCIEFCEAKWRAG